MANSKRRFIDKNGSMFIPMNVEGGTWNEHFITTPKLITIGVIIFSAIFIGMWLTSQYSKLPSFVIFYSLWAIISTLMMRYIIFEEKFYYRMYQQLKESEITTPALFWDIASTRETGRGAILTYSDAKIAIIIKLERDTITGKAQDFKETHYDAISDFYKEIVNHKYNFIQMNVMEQAGNDPRLQELDKLIHKNENKNICNLMEMQIGHIKNITRKTLYESDYVMIYTNDLQKMDTIMSDAIDCIYKILDGAYIGYRILNSRDVIELTKDEYGVRYFNSTDATLTMFKDRLQNTKSPFKLDRIIFSTGESQEVGNTEINKINKITSGVLRGTKEIRDISLKDALLSEENKNDGIDFDSIALDLAKDVGGNRDSKHINKDIITGNNNNQQYRDLDLDIGIDFDYDNDDLDFG